MIHSFSGYQYTFLSIYLFTYLHYLAIFLQTKIETIQIEYQ